MPVGAKRCQAGLSIARKEQKSNKQVKNPEDIAKERANIWKRVYQLKKSLQIGRAHV